MSKLDFLINYLLSERKDTEGIRIPDDNLRPLKHL